MKKNQITILIIALAILVAVILPRYLRFPAYSLEEARRELHSLCAAYAELRDRGASKKEWGDYAKKTQEITKPLVADIEKNNMQELGFRPLQQLARYHLPDAAASQGAMPAERLWEQLALSEENLKQSIIRKQPALKKKMRKKGVNVDWVTCGMLSLDAMILGLMGYIFLKPTAKELHSLGKLGVKDKQSLLHKLDERIAHGITLARHRGIRAKLLIEMGRHKEALDDIDWILNKEPHGVDLQTWYDLRNKIIEEKKAEG